MSDLLELLRLEAHTESLEFRAAPSERPDARIEEGEQP